MCGNSKKHLKIILMTTFTFFFCAFSPVSLAASAGSYTQTSEQQMTISMSITQWNTLKQELKMQNLELEQLRQKLSMLKGTSNEQLQLLDRLQKELNETQEHLTKANSSLNECQNALAKSKELLKVLKQEMQELEHKQTVTRRQRDAWAAIAALSLGGVIARR